MAEEERENSRVRREDWMRESQYIFRQKLVNITNPLTPHPTSEALCITLFQVDQIGRLNSVEYLGRRKLSTLRSISVSDSSGEMPFQSKKESSRTFTRA